MTTERLVFFRDSRLGLMHNVTVLLIGSIGGFLLSLTGMSVGWMLGTMLFVGYLAVQRPAVFDQVLPRRGLHPFWKQAGQTILAVQVGQQVTGGVVKVLFDAWLPVAIVLVLSLLFSVLLGLFLWKFSGDSLLTSLYAITPGGISNMPTIAEEVGANPITVSIIQTMRILLVVSIIPFFAMEWRGNESVGTGGATYTALDVHTNLFWTLCLLLAAFGGSYVGKRINLPAPRLVGGMIGVAAVQFLTTTWSGVDLLPWFPGWAKTIAQVLLGASIGAQLQREMFVGMGKTVLVGLISALALVFLMLGCSIIVWQCTGLSLITAILAFAPGGVAEMAITAVVLKANASFVVAVQTLRLIFIFLILPPIFRILSHKWTRS